jgi:hypothetical protein
MRKTTGLVVVLLVAVLTATATARTWQIFPDGSGDAPTVQAGLDSAATGDTVLVAPGTYYETIFWPFVNGIVLVGGGSENTIIVGDRVEAVLYMVGSSSSGDALGEASHEFARDHPRISKDLILAVPIDSATVVKGVGFRGGGDVGVVFFGASPILESCRVDSAGLGPGIHCLSGSAAQIRDCEIALNKGGIKVTDCAPLLTISGSTIAQNVASYGGGIYCHNSSPTITDNTITGNSASDGSGIYCDYAWPTIMNNTITENSASYGGGIHCRGSSYPTITNNAIIGNSASWGGGICCGSASPTITNNTISRNVATAYGGALYCYQSSPSVSLNTVTENEAGVGDAIYAEDSKPTISHSNIAFNEWGMYNNSYGTIPVAQDNWWGHSSGPWHRGGNSDGQGDSLSTYAWDFVPWLTEADTIAPPIPPLGLVVEGISSNSISLSWLPVPIADLEGYRVFFDRDTTGYSYCDSVDVGNVTEYTVLGLESETTYYLAVACYDRSGERSWYSAGVSAITQGGGGVPRPDSYAGLHFESVSPNPFTSQLVLWYVVPDARHTRVTVHDAQGRQIRELKDQTQSTGARSIVWDGRDAFGKDSAPGIYYIRLESGDDLTSTKAVLIR